MAFIFQPRGVCSSRMEVELEQNTIKEVRIEGGCSGNLQGLCALTKGQDAREIIGRLQGICCGTRPTSCPDQLSKALEAALTEGR